MKPLLCLLLLTSTLAAFGQRGERQASSLRDFEYDLQSTQEEIREVGRKLEAQEAIVDALRDQLFQAREMNEKEARGADGAFEGRIASIENNLKHTVSDLRTLQASIQDTSKVLSQMQKDMTHLQQAMKSLMGAFGSEGSSSTYKVKPGDSLDKIAKNQKVSVQEIKELNGLKNDRIITGQTLTLPSRS
jgi:chromosome segregation ATPase